MSTILFDVLQIQRRDQRVDVPIEDVNTIYIGNHELLIRLAYFKQGGGEKALEDSVGRMSLALSGEECAGKRPNEVVTAIRLITKVHRGV
jgi:hypothetical protein